MSVITASEFNPLHKIRSSKKGMLTEVIPNVGCEAVAYSAWDTIDRAETENLEEKALRDIAFARNMPGVRGKKLLISEYGFREEDSAARTKAAASAFIEAGTPFFYWEIYDNLGGEELGLIRPDGSGSRNYGALKEFLGGGYSVSEEASLWGSTCTLKADEESCTTTLRYRISDDRRYYAWTNGDEPWVHSEISGEESLQIHSPPRSSIPRPNPLLGRRVPVVRQKHRRCHC